MGFKFETVDPLMGEPPGLPYESWFGFDAVVVNGFRGVLVWSVVWTTLFKGDP